MRREGAIANKWENNWGFLTGEYRTVRELSQNMTLKKVEVRKRLDQLDMAMVSLHCMLFVIRCTSSMPPKTVAKLRCCKYNS